jgi:hypothetical protein
VTASALGEGVSVLEILRDDALHTTEDGFVLRICLPWIRSLPLASVVSLTTAIDGEPVEELDVVLGQRTIPVGHVSGEAGWWFVQDRLVVGGRRHLTPGPHDVRVSFDLIVPYLAAGPQGPLQLPFRRGRTLDTSAASVPTVALDVA